MHFGEEVAAYLDALRVGLVSLGEVGDGVVEVLLVAVGLFGDSLLELADFWVVRGGVRLCSSKKRHDRSSKFGVGDARAWGV